MRSLCMSLRPRHDCLSCSSHSSSHNAPIRPISTTHAQLSRQTPQQSSALPGKDRVSSALRVILAASCREGATFQPVTRQSSGLPGRVAPGSLLLSAQPHRGGQHNMPWLAISYQMTACTVFMTPLGVAFPSSQTAAPAPQGRE